MWPLPTDPRTSPHTGYTRRHWEAVADEWLAATTRYASPSGALLRIPGRHAWSGPESDALEGYARTLLLVACRTAHGDRPDLVDRYAEGLIAGTTPGGPESWPRGDDCRPDRRGPTQPIVEAANIAFALHLSRGRVWSRLDDGERARVVDWLRHHARLRAWPNNWLLFTAVIEAFLASVGVDTSGHRSDALVHRVESWHLGGGWYTDGGRRNVDHYNAWVIHPFLWAWYDMVGAERDPDAARLWRNRLAAFAADHARMFGANGSPLIQGRSLVYRTAALAPQWLAHLVDAPGTDPGATRRLASGVLRYFTDAGVGIGRPVGLGWLADDHLPMTQEYSGPGSPYFGAMGFLGLLLPADHPVWTAPERPQPAEGPDTVTALRDVGWLVQSVRDGGVVTVHNHGSDHVTSKTPDTDPFYGKLAYSSHGFPGTGAAFTDGCDGEFQRLGDTGDWLRRRAIAAHRVTADTAVSDNDYGDGTVTSATAVRGELAVRWHRTFDDRPVREGGWLLADPVATGAEDTVAWARDASGLCTVVAGLHGWATAGVDGFGAVTPLGDRAAVPVLRAPDGRDLVSLHLATRHADPVAWCRELRERLSVTVDAEGLTVVWPDGARCRVRPIRAPERATVAPEVP
ncbi:hypothetical protein LX16_2292 [Stackebrandtia albiflava]|uniref:DUF2264 domain-containing protein n=1 Tax=Stackebrandtia albiflava TaxID=406432 RepID=A0A562V190_9ACTN|nr:DUF2264 domain-containing protein [Stackebrandtia albiflava]TWJ11567.1 hypothetical protein LX16_2292 [Stackebrandtia albiflava]